MRTELKTKTTEFSSTCCGTAGFIISVMVMFASGMVADAQDRTTPSNDTNQAVRQESKAVTTDWSKLPLEDVRKAAEQGDSSARFHIGWRLELGDRVPQDYAEAAVHYRMAAEQGHAMAQNNLGNILQQGLGVQRDLSEAVEWFRRSAEQGEPYGQANLGWLHYSGRGLEKNREQAEYWFRKAANQEFAYAQYMMGQLARRQKQRLGNTVVGNFQVASEWYEKAAAQGHVKAMFSLGDLYYYGKLGHNHPEAAKWYRMAAKKGDPEAVMRMGELYAQNHKDLPADHAEAVLWFRIAAEKGNVEAEYRLGCLLIEGEGIALDPAEAKRWLRQASDNGFAEATVKLAALNHDSPESVLETMSRGQLEVASYNAGGETRLILARAYEEGLGGPVDLPKAAETYWRIMNLGPKQDRSEALRRLLTLYFDGKLQFEETAVYGPKDAEAFARRVPAWRRMTLSPETRFQIGEMFMNGHMLPEDIAAGVEWLTSAAQGGSVLAMNRLGELWAAGVGGEPDLKEAAAWHERAAREGLAEAQFKLGNAYRKGEGIEKDPIEAAAWLRLAANQGSSEAQIALVDVEATMTEDELNRIRSRASELAGVIQTNHEQE